MSDDISVSATPIGATATPDITTTPIDTSSDVSVSTPPANDDFDENIIPETSRDNFRKFRESQTTKAKELEEKLNSETRKRMEYEATISQFQAQQRNQKPADIGAQPDYKDFSTIEEYRDAVVKWAKQAGVSEFQGTLTQQQQQQRQAQEAQKMVDRGNAARMKYPDFNAITQPILPFAQQIPAVVQFIQEFDNGTDVLYHLGKNPAVLQAISKLQPFAAGQELLRIQTALSTPAPKAISQAPAPINPVNTGGDGNIKSVLEQVKKDNVEDFVARENRKELRKRRGAE